MDKQTPTTFVVTTKSHYCWASNIRISTPHRLKHNLGGTVFPDGKLSIFYGKCEMVRSCSLESCFNDLRYEAKVWQATLVTGPNLFSSLHLLLCIMPGNKLGLTSYGSYGAFTLDVKSMLNENLGGILGGTQC